jgi:hypothetical protein
MKDILEEALEICAEYEDIDANGNANCWMRVSMLITEALQYNPLPVVPKSASWQAGYNAGLAMAEKWRPIETAPKDSTPVLLGWYETWPNLEWVTESAAAGNADIAKQGAGYLHGYATHWMPLPKPPVILAGKEVSDE